MQNEAEKLPPRLSAAVEDFGDWWNKERASLDVAEKVTAPLFHYTDANALAGVLKNEEIWFTSIFHMNDPSELA
jgi:hypothetical protein